MPQKFTLQVRLIILLILIRILPAQAQTEQLSITLAVDAAEAPRKILHAKETIPVTPGPLILLYPKWIPGEHGPTGPVVDIAGLKVVAGGKPLTWRRDLEDMYALHLEVPTDVDQLDISFDFLSPFERDGFTSSASASAKLVVLSWNQVVLYPKGKKPDEITVTPSLTLPEGWKYGTALQVKEQMGNVIHFTPVSLITLVDSPVLAGAHFRRIDIASGSVTPHFLNLASDSEAALDITSEQITPYRRLILETTALFGARHYDHYDFLYALSDQIAHFGLEHHQSSDNRMPERTFLDDDIQKSAAVLLSHEFVHSWNGKYRRPTGLSTGDFSTPMKGDLLWVYEGLTQYLGKVLAARSGLYNADEFREDLALLAATLDNRPGREWRPLQDVADEAQLLYNARYAWNSWRRGVDFYDEGVLIWLEADVTIRQLTRGKKSLDDFCRRFHGGQSSSVMVKTYTFEEIVITLNDVTPYDWKTFLMHRLQSLNARAPLGGIEMSGWKLVYKETPSGMQKAVETSSKYIDLRFSLGIVLSREDGRLLDVIPSTPAASAGLAPEMKLVAVNGRKYSGKLLRTALKEGMKKTTPLELLAINGEFFKTYSVNYHGGERYPHLERDRTKSDLLTTIIKPIAPK